MLASRFRFCYRVCWLEFLLTGFVSCEIVLLQLNEIYKSICFQTHKQLANIKLQTQIFTRSKMVHFCVNKSPTFNVTSLITVQLACSNMVCPSHPLLIRRLSINRFLLVIQSKYHTIYFHTLFNNSISIAHLNDEIYHKILVIFRLS